MSLKTRNTFKDFLGSVRAVSYRTFVEWNWSKIQPMFNILEVEEGKEQLFEAFLKKSLGISLKYDTPISLGPFKTNDSPTYIYITHYASTPAYMKVMGALLTKGAAAMRAEATLSTSWTYCKATDTPALQDTEEIIMTGIQGDTAAFMAHLNQNGIQPLATITKKKDVRGHALGTYILFHNTKLINSIINEFIQQGGDIITYHATKLA